MWPGHLVYIFSYVEDSIIYRLFTFTYVIDHIIKFPETSYIISFEFVKVLLWIDAKKMFEFTNKTIYFK